MKAKNNNFKYFVIARFDEIVCFVTTHLKWLIIYSVALVFGLVIGVISAMKPLEPLVAFASHNQSLFELIEQAAFLQYFFSSLFVFLVVMALSVLVGKLPFSPVLFSVISVVLGYFQGGTVILLMRSYGLIALPLTICYSLTTLLLDMVVFCQFAMLSAISVEQRKFGCSVPLIKILTNSVYPLIFGFIVIVLRYLLVILFSFFL